MVDEEPATVEDIEDEPVELEAVEEHTKRGKLKEPNIFEKAYSKAKETYHKGKETYGKYQEEQKMKKEQELIKRKAHEEEKLEKAEKELEVENISLRRRNVEKELDERKKERNPVYHVYKSLTQRSKGKTEKGYTYKRSATEQPSLWKQHLQMGERRRGEERPSLLAQALASGGVSSSKSDRAIVYQGAHKESKGVLFKSLTTSRKSKGIRFGLGKSKWRV
jgi:hypothetical protein